MGAGTVFLLLLVVVLVAGIGFAFYALRAGLWAKETSTTSDDPEADARGETGERPEHRRVDEPGNQRFVG
jgi:hypothetical protein